MNEKIVKILLLAKLEKGIDNFYSKYRKCKACDFKRVMKR